MEEFNESHMQKISRAAAALCVWVLAIVEYAQANKVATPKYQPVEPIAEVATPKYQPVEPIAEVVTLKYQPVEPIVEKVRP